MALLFQRIASNTPPTLFQIVNQANLTFLQLAATSLNFWVLTFMVKNYPVETKTLFCLPNNAPLINLAKVIPEPRPPVVMPPVAFPEYFQILDMLEQYGQGSVPHADVVFDVGLDSSEWRFPAHRVVVAAQSPVLLEELVKMPRTLLPREKIKAVIFRVDQQISKEVWRVVLEFMYTGVISCSFSDDVYRILELFRAAVLYKLPRPFVDFAQFCLYQLLPVSPPLAALHVFSICAGSMADGVDVTAAREASTYILLRSAHELLEGFESKEACLILDQLVHTVEQATLKS